MPIGFRPDGLTMVGYDVGLAGYSPARGIDFEARSIEAVRRLPGIESAAFADTIPLYLNHSTTTVTPDDQPDLPASKRFNASRFCVSADYFETMGTRIVQGRALAATDTATMPLVAVINPAFATRVLKTSTPIGRRFHDGGHGDKWVEVVGLAEEGRYTSLSEDPQPAVFEPIAQNYQATISLMARSTLPPDQVINEIRQAFGALDPAIPLYETQTVAHMLGVVLLPSRAAAMALGFFGVLALVLALTGLNGVVANAVARRRREIGIRVAIGARPGDVLRLILARTAWLLAVGTLVGLGLVRLAGQVLASVVYQASPHDPFVISLVVSCLLLVGFIACWAPARRALRVSPIQALKTE
jgi:predicted permease